MPFLRISRRAQADFDQIIEYLNDVAGPLVAGKYGRDIQAAINRIAGLPGLGSPRPALGADVRVAIVRPYLIFYEAAPEDGSVFVLRILHGHRDITGEMMEEKG